MNQILIASNNSRIASALGRLFVECDDLCVSCAEYNKILAILGGNTPNIIIVEDRGFTDAKECLLKLRSKFPSANIIFISSFLENEEREELRAIKCVDSVLVKPCSKRAILKAANINQNNRSRKVIDHRSLHSIVEAYGSKNIVVYRCYTQVSNCLSKLDSLIECDLEYVHDVLAYYLCVIMTLDDELIFDLLSGVQSKKETVLSLIEQIEKMRTSAAVTFAKFDSEPLVQMLYINKLFNGKGFPKDDRAGYDIPFVSRLLRILFDFNYLVEKGKTTGESIFILKSRNGWYDKGILSTFIDALGDEAQFYNRDVYPLGLQPNMIMAQDLYGIIEGKRVLIIRIGQSLSEKNIDFIHRHGHDILDVTEPVLIRESVLLCEGDDA